MEKDLIEYLRRINQASYSKVENRLSKYGLVKGQAELLSLIKENEGCTQKDLAIALNVKYSSISERLNKLQTLGYIERNIDDENSKFKRIYITSEGKQAALQARRIQNEFTSELYRGFTKKDIKALEEYMERLVGNIENL